MRRKRADVLLSDMGFGDAVREHFLRPIHRIVRNINWSGRTGSVIIFRAPGFTKASFWPDALAPRVHLADEFLVLPLLAGIGVARLFLGLEGAELMGRMVFEYIILNGRPFRMALLKGSA